MAGDRRVMDLTSGRRVRVGSAEYNELLRSGRARDMGGETLQPLMRASDDFAIQVYEIWDPSRQARSIRNTLIVLPGSQALADAVNAYVAGGRWDQTIGPFIPNAFMRANIANFAIGPFRFDRNDNDLDGEVDEVTIDVGTLNRMMRLDRMRNLRADAPLRLPFTNIDLNAGDDGMCVGRFLGTDVEPTTLQGMLDKATEMRLMVEVYDVLGGLRTDNHQEVTLRTAVAPPSRCVVYGDHVYPIMWGKEPELVEGPMRFVAEEAPELLFPPDAFERRLWLDHRVMCYKDTGKTYVANTPTMDGVWMRLRPATEEWMRDVIRLPRECVWDPATLDTFVRGTSVLAMSLPCIRATNPNHDPLDGFVTIDMSKCYYWACWAVLNAERFSLPFSVDVHTRFVPCDDKLGDNLRRDAFYLVQENLRHLGLLRNLLPGYTIKLLRANNVTVTVYAECVMRRVNGWQRGALKKITDVTSPPVAEFEARRKAFATVVGIWSITTDDEQREIELCSHVDGQEVGLEEKLYYASRYPDWKLVDGWRFQRVSSTPRLYNRAHAWVAVVHMANHLCLEKLFQIKRECVGWAPVKIHVDSLTYAFSPFHRRKEELAPYLQHDVLRSFAEAPWHWKFEEPKLAVTPPSSVKLGVPPETVYERNMTYTGPPGTGKTTRAMRDHVFDYAVCYSNRGACRLAGMGSVDPTRCMTVHKLLKCWNTYYRPIVVGLEHLKGARVFVDEAQACSRRMWAWFAFLYEKLDVSFVFAMDPDQVGPVEDEERIEIGPFMGRVIRMLVNYRNDTDLVEARERVLRGTYQATFMSPDDTRFTQMNIAHYRNTCARVNREVRERLALVPGQAGLYQVLKPHQGFGLVHGDVMRYDGTHMRSEGTMFNLRMHADAVRKLMQKGFLDWGYCLTVHSTVGMTIEEPLTIHDWDDDNNTDYYRALKYTAMTRVRSLTDVYFRKCVDAGPHAAAQPPPSPSAHAS